MTEEEMMDKAIWTVTGEILGLQQRILDCKNLDDFMALQMEIRTKWDADAANGREIWRKALEQAGFVPREASESK